MTRTLGGATRSCYRLVLVVCCVMSATSTVQAQASSARGGGGGGRGAIRIMTLTSSAFRDGGMIPEKHAQAGRDVSPPLAWSGQPDTVVSYVLLVHDIDAPAGDGTTDMLHWMVWGIPGSVTALAEGLPQGTTLALPGVAPSVSAGRGGGATRQLSVTGPNYRGPAASSTGPAHHYVFELYALDIHVTVQAAGQQTLPTREAVWDAMKTHIRAKGTLVGMYRRPAP